MELDDPVPVGGQVLIRVRACGVCRRDVLVSRTAARGGLCDPLVLGHEIAGDVVAVGENAIGVAVGDRVATTQRAYVCGCCSRCRTGRETLCPDLSFLGQQSMGGYAEFVLVNHDNVARLPDGLDYVSAAIVGCPVGTALNAVSDTGDVKAGEDVLVVGMGGLGSHALQIARAAGARVIAATRTASKEGFLRRIGADEVIVAPNGSFSAGVRSVTGGKGADLVVDTVGGASFREGLRSVGFGGRIVLVGDVTGEKVEISTASIYRRGLQIRSAVSTSREQLSRALELVACGKVRPLVDRTIPLSEAAEAHRLVEANETTGRIVLVP
ncbi:MAG: alcohol dehydrogenase catalytic domain-containing protein [Proteobacteria bacterium]|nr:alcohol dehydrogenase catalytic domain-containing protein [Pseudomonadota bacterium]